VTLSGAQLPTGNAQGAVESTPTTPPTTLSSVTLHAKLRPHCCAVALLAPEGAAALPLPATPKLPPLTRRWFNASKKEKTMPDCPRIGHQAAVVSVTVLPQATACASQGPAVEKMAVMGSTPAPLALVADPSAVFIVERYVEAVGEMGGGV